MADVQILPLSALQPVELKYNYNTTEPLLTKKVTYNTGLNTVVLEGTEQFQDVTFNNETCLILTSSVNLSSFFTTQLFENNFFGSVLLRPRSTAIYYVAYNPTLNNLYLSPSATQIYIAPVSGTNEVELFVNRKYLQVDDTYPFEVFLNERSLDPESLYRQRFVCTIQNGNVMFRTRTQFGDRYIGFSTDGVLRATGTVLNNVVLNDYVFNIEYIAVNTGIHGFIPVNDFVTYYFDFESTFNNKNLVVNKQINNTSTNFLISFPFESITENTANINIANLKNIATPEGGLATFDNSYDKPVITTN